MSVAQLLALCFRRHSACEAADTSWRSRIRTQTNTAVKVQWETTPPVEIGSAPPPPVKVFSARDLAPLPRPSGPDSRGCCSPPRCARGDPPRPRSLQRAAAAHWLPLSRSPRSFLLSTCFSGVLFYLPPGRLLALFFFIAPLLPCVVFFPSLSGRRGSSRCVLLVDCCAAFTIVCRRGPTGCASLVVPPVRNFVVPPSLGELLRQVRRRSATRA